MTPDPGPREIDVEPHAEVGAATLAKPWDNGGTLFVDPATGDGYVIYMQQSDHGLVVEQLNFTFSSGTGDYSLVSTTTVNGTDSSEAPSMFVRGGVYYLVYSTPACGFCHTGVPRCPNAGAWTRPTPSAELPPIATPAKARLFPLFTGELGRNAVTARGTHPVLVRVRQPALTLNPERRGQPPTTESQDHYPERKVVSQFSGH